MHDACICTKMCTKGILWLRDFNEISANSYQISSTHCGQNHICLTISDLTLSFLFSGWKENIQYLNHYLQGNSLSTDVCSVGKNICLLRNIWKNICSTEEQVGQSCFHLFVLLHQKFSNFVTLHSLCIQTNYSKTRVIHFVLGRKMRTPPWTNCPSIPYSTYKRYLWVIF